MSENHPWYGPCDSMGPHGECCECSAIQDNDYRSAKISWWKDMQDKWERDAVRRDRRKERKARASAARGG